MKKILLFFLLAFVSLNIFAQEKPIWLDGNFKETSQSYLKVVVGSCSSYSPKEYARDNALLQIYKDNVINAEAKVKLYGEMIHLEGDNTVNIKARVIDEYYEKVDYTYNAYLLIQIAKDPSYQFDEVRISDDYPFSARVLVPGMSQIYKGQSTKGVCFIGGEILFVGSAIVSHSMMTSNINKINSTHNSSLRYQYTKNANTWQTMRNISIAGAAAVYIWNIIDGIAAKGEERVFLGMNNVSVSPYSDLNSTGIALNLKF